MLKRPPLPPHLKRYGWFRMYNDFAGHPKWRLVARKAGIPVVEVVAIAAALLCAASKATRRGSLEDFDAPECAVALDIPTENVVQAYSVLEELGWIDQDVIVDWDDRQPDREDPTAAERQRRRRSKLAAGRHGKQVGVTRDMRDVTPDETRPITSSSTSAPSAPTTSDLAEALAEAEKWLIEEGVRTVISRANINGAVARLRIAKWRKECAGDAPALKAIILAVAAHGLSGDSFVNAVVDSIRRHVANLNPALPFGPALAKR